MKGYWLILSGIFLTLGMRVLAGLFLICAGIFA